MNTMKSLYLCLLVCCVVGFSGCGQPEENALATDGASADDFAKYEAELDAVSGGDSYEDSGEESDDK